MEVDLQRRHDLTVHVDITFHAIPCAGAVLAVGVRIGQNLTCSSCVCAAQICKSQLLQPTPAPSHPPPLHPPTPPHPPTPALSVNVLDASGTSGSDASSTSGGVVHLHKWRLNPAGRPIGKGGAAGEYTTPQTVALEREGNEMVMTLDMGASMQVRPGGGVEAWVVGGCD